MRDDGAGFDVAAPSPGAGLTNMRDRIVAVGGRLTIESSERGTVVLGSVPVRADVGDAGQTLAPGDSPVRRSRQEADR